MNPHEEAERTLELLAEREDREDDLERERWPTRALTHYLDVEGED